MKVKIKKIVTLFIFAVFILIQGISVGASIADETEKNKKIECMVEDIANLSNEEEETLNAINKYRRQNGLSDLKAISKLQDIAKIKAEDIVENEYFSHNSENLGTPFEMLKANDVKYKFAGENLAGSNTPEKAVSAWINSPAHRDNILDENYEYTGIYVVDSPVYGKIFVQIFLGV